MKTQVTLGTILLFICAASTPAGTPAVTERPLEFPWVQPALRPLLRSQDSLHQKVREALIAYKAASKAPAEASSPVAGLHSARPYSGIVVVPSPVDSGITVNPGASGGALEIIEPPVTLVPLVR